MALPTPWIRNTALFLIAITSPLLIIPGGGCRQAADLDNEIEDKIVPVERAQIEAPYLLLNRQNWRDYDPGKAEESVAATVQSGDQKAVTVHDATVIDWANKQNAFVQLKPSITAIPVSAVQIKREKAVSKADVLFDRSFESNLGITAIGESANKWSRYYAFKADLVLYKASYVFSISELATNGVLSRGELDLRGLPRNYFVFDVLDANSGSALDVKVGGTGSFGIVTVGGKAKTQYDKSSVASFRHKVFAVDFMREESYLRDEAYKDTGTPIRRTLFQFAHLPSEEDEDFIRWRAAGDGTDAVRVVKQYLVTDAGSKKRYAIKVWVKKPAQQASQMVDQRATVEASEYDGAESNISIDGGTDRRLPPDKGTLVSRYQVEKPDPYNSDWFYYVPGKSLEIVAVDDAWRTRQDFVRFVE